MLATYILKPDAAYCRTVMDRFYRQRPFLLRLPGQFFLAASPLIGVIVYAWITGASWKLVATFGGFAFGLVCIGAVHLTKALIQRRLVQGRDFWLETTIAISEDGLSATNEHGSSTLKWSAYPRSVRFPDGILLLRRGAIRWLPDFALVGDSRKIATDLIQSKTQFRRVA